MADERTVQVSGDSTGFSQVIQVGPHQLIADEPESLGGKDIGPNPYELLLSSLGSCTSMTVSMYARTKNWPLKSVNVQLRHHKDKVTKVDYIERDIQLIGDLSEEQHARLLDIANKCPINRTLKSEIEISSKLV